MLQEQKQDAEMLEDLEPNVSNSNAASAVVVV
jgi:hypothetical protein